MGEGFENHSNEEEAVNFEELKKGLIRLANKSASL